MFRSLLLTALTAVCLAPNVVFAQTTFIATLNAAQEVPAPNVPVGYIGGGFGTVTITSPTNVRVKLDVSNLTSGVTVAHIHQAAPGVAGPVRLDLLPTQGNTFLNIDRDYTVSSVFTTNFLNGVPYYFNVHTSLNGAGEVRGNLTSTPEPSEWVFMGTAASLLVFGMVRKRRNAATAV